MQEEDLRYPIGTFQKPSAVSAADRERYLGQIAEAPAKLRAAVAGLSPTQLDTPYREGGWTVRQVAHHVPDSHMNSYVRFKLALTEDTPTIRPYNETSWAKLHDSRSTPVETSLAMMDALHDRWMHLLRGMSEQDFGRTLMHPESGAMTLDDMVALYAWHGRHHVAHITGLRKRKGW